MPDQRKHRGPHPDDLQLFAESQLTKLQSAVHDLSWLLTKGYATPSALKLVGDRYALDSRQRTAVNRCACTDAERELREKKTLQPDQLENHVLWIDGYNVLTSVEAALSGGVILHARDDCYRDMASMHGSYRKVEETLPAIRLIGEILEACQLAECYWLLDQPVSNSGRLKTMLYELAADQEWNWQIELVADPDANLIACPDPVASSDSQILNGCQSWFNLARYVIDQRVPDAWRIELSDKSHID